MGATSCRPYLSGCLAAVIVGTAVGATSGPSQPQGLGPQHLWPTPAAFVVPPPVGSAGAPARWLEVMAAHVQALSSDVNQDEHSWQSAGKSFIEDCVAVGGPAAAAGFALRRHIEAAATSYFRQALGAKAPKLADRVQVRVEHSWAHLVRGQEAELPHVHARAALAGTLYLQCEGGNKAPDAAAQHGCGIFLQDPRTPAGTADMPESLRRRLGWGEVQSFRVSEGSLVLHPAWLQHAALPSLPTVSNSRGELHQRLGISFTVVVQLIERASETKSSAKPPVRYLDDLDAPSDEL
eukprot:TRINITY_DN44295_c0_g1_i1.p1 TRINITY_DN44295_c0_g1~~TRINITY_DN44295_c0_g1_i1.p1  ORF type:complete len:294 (-),score=45.37 TRINITY_DN44295_c0_g1_i1:42-923(-)